MIEIVKTKADLCTGCNRCVRECPLEMANVVYQDENGKLKIKIDYDKCIACGRCVPVCKHKARYYTDDTERFFDDLKNGVPISLIVNPSTCSGFPSYKKLFTFFKKSGVNKIANVSLGSDICIWAHLKYLEEKKALPMITQICPAVVSYCEIYHHDLLPHMSPVHGPMGCASVYLKEYLGIGDNIALLSPCIPRVNEFENAKLAKYVLNYTKLQEYLVKNNIKLPQKETDFDYSETELGSMCLIPGGVKENVEYLFGNKFHIVKVEGHTVYKKLDEYAEAGKELLPDIFDVLNCAEGCNMGSACPVNRNLFEFEQSKKISRMKMPEERRKEHFEATYKKYNDKFKLSKFLRKYRSVKSALPKLTDKDINKAFKLLGKTTYENQNIDCGSCGSETCLAMARKIALGISIPFNCIAKEKEDV